MKKKIDHCIVCGEAIYEYSGKDVPDIWRRLGASVVGGVRTRDGKNRRCHKCAGVKSAFGVGD